MSKGIRRVVVLPDIHAPKEDKKAMRAVLKFIRDYQPHELIQLGDLCDFDSISRFDTAREKDLVALKDEVEAANVMLDSIEAVLPRGCKKVILEGNHDHRPEMYRLNRWDKNVMNVLGMSNLPNWDVLYNLKKRNWETREYGELYKLGKAMFSHGWFTNSYHASKTVHRWFKTIIYGHTHTYQVHSINGLDGKPVMGMSIGTLSRFDLSYLRGLPPDWVTMFMYMDYWRDGTFTPHAIPIINGAFTAEGKRYEG